MYPYPRYIHTYLKPVGALFNLLHHSAQVHAGDARQLRIQHLSEGGTRTGALQASVSARGISAGAGMVSVTGNASPTKQNST